MSDRTAKKRAFTNVAIWGVCALLAIAGLAAYGRPEPAWSSDRIVASDNILLVFACSAMAVSAAYLVYERLGFEWWRAGPTEVFLIGIVLGNSGWVLHRAHWAIWRGLRDRGYWVEADLFETGLHILPSAGFVLIVIGVSMALNIWLRIFSEKHWFALGIFVSVTIWLVAYEAISLTPGNPF